MPKYIKKKHTQRMFPFEFFDELSEQLKDYVIYNPVFLARRKRDIPKDVQKHMYKVSRNNEIIETLHQSNIIEVEPFGEVLILELCCSVEDVDTIIYDKEERSQSPLYFLICQLYDSARLPVFSKDVTEETIEKIPEVLWDDPNLMLGIVSFSSDDGIIGEGKVGILKIPQDIEQKLFEPITADESEESEVDSKDENTNT